MRGPAVSSVAITFTVVIVACSMAVARPLIDDSVAVMVQAAAPSTSIALILTFDDELDYAALKAAYPSSLQTRQANYALVMRSLLANRSRLESAVAPALAAMREAGTVSSYRFHTVSRTVFVRTRLDNIDNILALPGLTTVNYNHAVALVPPVESIPVEAEGKAALANSALETINVR